MTKWVVTFDYGRDIGEAIISTHRTLSGAERAFRRRNPHLFNRKWAMAQGMAHTGTFDRIRRSDEGVLDRGGNYAPSRGVR